MVPPSRRRTRIVKVALAVNRFPSVSETFVYNHAAGLRAAGIDVTVVASRKGNDAELFADFDGVAYDGPIIYRVLQRSPLLTMQQLAGTVTRRQALPTWKAARERYGRTRRALRAWLLALPFEGFDLVHLEYSGLAVAWRDA